MALCNVQVEILGLVCALIVIALAAVYKYLTWTYDYWQKQGVPGNKPKLFIGTFEPIWKKSEEKQGIEAIKKYGRTLGQFEGRTPILLTADPEIIKKVTVKDFSKFPNRKENNTFEENAKTLLNLRDDEWREMRNLLTPTFTSGKLKQMVELVEECVKNFIEHLSVIERKDEVIDFRRQFSILTIDVIANIAFGMKIDSLHNPNNEFIKHATRVFQPTTTLIYLRAVSPRLFSLLRPFTTSPFKYFTNVANQAIEMRLKNQDFNRKDFLQILLQAEKDQFDGSNKKIISRDKLLAQTVLFLLAGHETTATTLSFTSYCLAINPEVQNKLIQEVDNAMTENKGIIKYETVMELQYLDMVISEALRMYPPAIRVARQCAVNNYKIDNITLDKGVLIYIPIYALHHDPDFYPNPDVFDPERFSPENNNTRNPYVYLPFGSGPRNCIAKRFALMETKLALVHILSKFRFVTCKKTEIPIKLSATIGLLQSGPINLMLEKRTDGPTFD